MRAIHTLACEILDWLYPPICEICGLKLSDGKALCEACVERLPHIAPPFCEICGEYFQGLIDGPFDCPNCREVSFHFEFARAALDRSDDALELVHRLKYGREIHLGAELGRLACRAFSDRRLAVALEEKWPLVPVPLHRSRQIERQFNQAEEIARSIALETGLPVWRLLKRVRRTETQTRLSRKQRMENLRGAFALGMPFPEILPPGFLLVDDVFTTGSTVDECAKVLRKAGAGRIAVLSVMRG
jgi:competence protein ComFC